VDSATAMNRHREGKITLRSYSADAAPLPKVDSKLHSGTLGRGRAVQERCSHANCALTSRLVRVASTFFLLDSNPLHNSNVTVSGKIGEGFHSAAGMGPFNLKAVNFWPYSDA
jgi:hypothetical protein